MNKPIFPIFQIKVTLLRIKPPIWRRLLVSSNTTLADLHIILQVAMGWGDSHLHMFTIGERSFSNPFYPELLAELQALDSTTVHLSDLIPLQRPQDRKSRPVMKYEYDFGDGWDHRLEFEDVLTPEPGQKTPICIKGARACPPEDCGGPYLYPEFLAALKDPAHPEHETYTEWIGAGFDPEAFDLKETNDRIGAWIGHR